MPLCLLWDFSFPNTVIHCEEQYFSRILNTTLKIMLWMLWMGSSDYFGLNLSKSFNVLFKILLVNHNISHIWASIVYRTLNKNTILTIQWPPLTSTCISYFDYEIHCHLKPFQRLSCLPLWIRLWCRNTEQRFQIPVIIHLSLYIYIRDG